jgi:hypothetical protein
VTIRLIVAVLAMLGAAQAGAADQWRTYKVGPNTYTDGPGFRSRSWQDGSNTYTETQRDDGGKTRCRSWVVRPNTYTHCD